MQWGENKISDMPSFDAYTILEQIAGIYVAADNRYMQCVRKERVYNKVKNVLIGEKIIKE